MKKLAGALGATMLAITIVALYLWSQLHTERQQLAALQARVSELEVQQKTAAEAAAASALAIAANSTAAASPDAPPGVGAAPPKPASPAQAGDRLAAGIKELISSPDVLGGALRQQFPDAAQVLGLSPAEVDKFYVLLGKQAADSVGDAMGLLGGGSGAAAQEAGRKMVEKQLANDKAMAALLGGRYPQWEEYQGTMAARQQVSQLRVMLGSGENALTEAKAKPLIAALGSETARINNELKKKMVADVAASKNVMEEQLKYTSEQNNRLLSVASSHLSSAQLDRYKQMLSQQEMMVRALLGSGNKQGAAP